MRQKVAKVGGPKYQMCKSLMNIAHTPSGPQLII